MGGSKAVMRPPAMMLTPGQLQHEGMVKQVVLHTPVHPNAARGDQQEMQLNSSIPNGLTIVQVRKAEPKLLIEL